MPDRLFAWLALPLALLLFAQWPLRDLVQGYATEANDAAQVLFALYAAAAVPAAMRAGTHLVARRGGPGGARFRRIALVVCLAPWCVFLLAGSAPLILQSVAQFERFPGTGNPGYWLLKLALWLLAGGVLVQALRGRR